MSLDPARIAAIRARADKATKGPWGWHWEDASLQYLAGPNELEDHVLAVSPCESCQARAEELAKAGRGAGCTTGSPNDHEFIAHAREDIPYLLDQIAQQAQEIQELLSRVGPSVPCVAPIGSTTDKPAGEVTAAERTEKA